MHNYPSSNSTSALTKAFPTASAISTLSFLLSLILNQMGETLSANANALD